MTNLTIHLGGKNVGLVLPEGTISISIENHLAVESIASPKLEWSKTLLDGDSVNYESAEKAVSTLGAGWRIPTRIELESLIDLSRHDPAIDTEKYPDTKSKYYWTSTPCAWNDTAVWVVGFGYGFVGSDFRSHLACVRAVRSSQ
jgi:hypothetical protein